MYLCTKPVPTRGSSQHSAGNNILRLLCHVPFGFQTECTEENIDLLGCHSSGTPESSFSHFVKYWLLQKRGKIHKEMLPKCSYKIEMARLCVAHVTARVNRAVSSVPHILLTTCRVAKVHVSSVGIFPRFYILCLNLHNKKISNRRRN